MVRALLFFGAAARLRCRAVRDRYAPYHHIVVADDDVPHRAANLQEALAEQLVRELALGHRCLAPQGERVGGTDGQCNDSASRNYRLFLRKFAPSG